MTLDASGRLGVGITSPTERLHISGNAIVTGTITEGTVPVVVQSDIGSASNEIPLNQHLGAYAFLGKEAFVAAPAASATPAGIGELVFQLTNNTTLVIKVKGSDGTVRSNTLTLT